MVSGQEGDAAQGLSGTRPVQLGELGLNFGLILTQKGGSFSPEEGSQRGCHSQAGKVAYD